MINFVFCLLFVTLGAGEESSSELLKDVATKFSARMYSEVAELNHGKSMVVSAFSVLPPLAELALAAVGESHDDILKVIGLPNDNVTKEVFSPIPGQIRSAQGIELKLASRVYIPEGFELNDNFAAISRDVFDSEVQKVNFLKRQETADVINKWVEDHTNNRIHEMVSPDSFNEDSRGVLVNAIYFKGDWLRKFETKFTEEKDFHVTKEKSIKVPMMFKNDELFYGENDELDAKVVELPYEGYEASFYIFMPNQVDGLSNLEEKLKDPSAMSRAIQRMYETKVDLTLPKFKIESTIDLKDVLTKLGAGRLFDVGARLDNLLKGATDLYVGEAKQKVFIEINEEGAEAAAANTFLVFTRSFKAIRTVQFTVDRPFYFVLMHKTIPLFCGRYAA